MFSNNIKHETAIYLRLLLLLIVLKFFDDFIIQIWNKWTDTFKDDIFYVEGWLIINFEILVQERQEREKMKEGNFVFNLDECFSWSNFMKITYLFLQRLI